MQQEIFEFVQLWNNHIIQQQKNQFNAVTDKSIMLYYYLVTVFTKNYETFISQDILNETEILFND